MMGVLDQASRYAAQADPEVVLRHLRGLDASLRFRRWVDTRTTPRPGQTDRTADRVAELSADDATDRPWLLIFEFQSQHDEDKLDATLAEVGQMRLEARHGADRRGKYRVLVALIYLRGKCPDTVLDMTQAGGGGTKHVPLLWEVANDSAGKALDALEAGTATWGILFWVPLMSGGDDPALLARWKDQASRVENARVRSDLVQIALFFAELAGRLAVWADALKEWNMYESQLFKEWTAEALRRGERSARRQDLLQILQERFPDTLTAEVSDLITRQESDELLRDWFRAALRAASAEEFLTVLRR
jgi:hypothetical protein